MLSPLLFFTPDVYIRKLAEMYVDNLINEGPWNRFWDDMRRDWERATTPVCLAHIAAINLQLKQPRSQYSSQPMWASWLFRALTSPVVIRIEVLRRSQLTLPLC
jgi:hypothetical protein